MAPMTHSRMMEMQARLPPLAGFPASKYGRIMRDQATSPANSRGASFDAKSTSAGYSSAESEQLDAESHTSSHMLQYQDPTVDKDFFPSDHSTTPSTREHSPEPLRRMPSRFEEVTSDDDFFPSDHSTMPSTRESSPEPFRETAKRYGLREEDIFPQSKLFLNPTRQIPLMQLLAHLLPSDQRNPTHTGLTQDQLGRFDRPEGCRLAVPAATLSQGGCFKSDDDSDICKDMGDSSTGVTTSTACFVEMQRESVKLNRDTQWIRVVHRGYGQVAWRDELSKLKVPIVHGSHMSEGEYIMIPAGLDAHQVVDTLVKVNQNVRRIVWFKGMKRANKSRLLFRWEPFSVSPKGDEMPNLLETKAFSHKD